MFAASQTGFCKHLNFLREETCSGTRSDSPKAPWLESGRVRNGPGIPTSIQCWADDLLTWPWPWELEDVNSDSITDQLGVFWTKYLTPLSATVQGK